MAQTNYHGYRLRQENFWYINVMTLYLIVLKMGDHNIRKIRKGGKTGLKGGEKLLGK